MKNFLISLINLALLSSCVPPAQQGSSSYVEKELLFEDHIYEENIKSVTLYPYSGEQRDLLRTVAIPITQDEPVHLSFDELSTESKSYYVKLIYCNANWTESFVPQVDFIDAFNELLITDYELSNATRVPYTNYRVTIPRLKLPGNYLIKVYRNKDESDLVLTKRLMVYSDQLRIMGRVSYSNSVQLRNQNQQIDFSIQYGNMELVNPLQNINVMIRQNQRWDNAIYNLKPQFVREAERLLEYNYFNLENNFKGGNEFRAFDIRSINFPGQNVGRIINTPVNKEVFLNIDRTRAGKPYTLIPDINGKFVVDNYDFQIDSTSGGDYINVNFSLEAEKIEKDVYIFGALSNWRLHPDFKMSYNTTSKRYEGKALLKQGWYNFAYGIPDQNGRVNTTFFEGNHFETENEYEIVVYYRPVGSRADLIIGYYNIAYNFRN